MGADAILIGPMCSPTRIRISSFSGYARRQTAGAGVQRDDLGRLWVACMAKLLVGGLSTKTTIRPGASRVCVSSGN